MSTTNFETRVRMELLKRRMRLRDLAELIGVSPDYVSKILTGRRAAPARRIQIIETLEVSHERSKKQEDGDCHDHQKRNRQDLDRPRLAERAREAV